MSDEPQSGFDKLMGEVFGIIQGLEQWCTDSSGLAEGSRWRIKKEHLNLIPKTYPTATCKISCFSSLYRLVTIDFENGSDELLLPETFVRRFDRL